MLIEDFKKKEFVEFCLSSLSLGEDGNDWKEC